MDLEKIVKKAIKEAIGQEKDDTENPVITRYIAREQIERTRISEGIVKKVLKFFDEDYEDENVVSYYKVVAENELAAIAHGLYEDYPNYSPSEQPRPPKDL